MYPLITITMPVYNVERHIEDSIRSALDQTYPNIEVIVVDDRGTDNSIGVVRRVMSEHPRGSVVRIIEHPQNLHTGASRNTGIDNAKGEYIFFLDSDDVLIPECLEWLYGIAQKENVDVVISSQGRYENVETANPVMRERLKDVTRDGRYSLLNYTQGEINGKYPIGMVNKLFRLDFIRKYNIRCIPHHLQEDVWFSFQVLVYAESFASTSRETYRTINHNDSQSHVKFTQFHVIQNREICEAEQSLMRSLGNLPKGLIDIYLSRLKGIIPNMRGAQCPETVIREAVLSYTDLRGIKGVFSSVIVPINHVTFLIYKTHSYDIIRHYHTLLMKF